MKQILFDDIDFYIIHIKQYQNRYEHLKNEFKKLNIDIENNNKINWVDGIVPESRFNYRNNGTYGVALGHLSAIEQSIKNNSTYCLIVEDDVIFLDNFIENFNLTFRNLTKNQENYDIVQFRTPRFPCNNIDCKIIDNYITGHCRFVPTECIFLTNEIRQKISNNKKWFLNGRAIDLWYTRNLRCIKTLSNYTLQNTSFGSIRRSSSTHS